MTSSSGFTYGTWGFPRIYVKSPDGNAVETWKMVACSLQREKGWFSWLKMGEAAKMWIEAAKTVI